MLQNFEQMNAEIAEAFSRVKREQPQRLERRLALSWSNWGFGREPLEVSLARLRRSGIELVELHGNHHTPDLGYRAGPTRAALRDAGIRAAGICGIFGPDHDLSSNRAVARQGAIDYIRRELEFGAEVGAEYFIVVPGAVGRTTPLDENEVHRSADTLRLLGDEFAAHGIRAAVEPIRSAEVSLVHTVEEVIAYIQEADHPAISHINADLYHMQSEETHIGQAITRAGERLVNLHLADSNRRALGLGSLDLDTVIRALYLIGFNRDGCYCTPEPLGPGGDPYPAMFGRPDPELLDDMVRQTADYFRAREEQVIEQG